MKKGKIFSVIRVALAIVVTFTAVISTSLIDAQAAAAKVTAPSSVNMDWKGNMVKVKVKTNKALKITCSNMLKCSTYKLKKGTTTFHAIALPHVGSSKRTFSIYLKDGSKTVKTVKVIQKNRKLKKKTAQKNKQVFGVIDSDAGITQYTMSTQYCEYYTYNSKTKKNDFEYRTTYYAVKVGGNGGGKTKCDPPKIVSLFSSSSAKKASKRITMKTNPYGVYEGGLAHRGSYYDITKLSYAPKTKVIGKTGTTVCIPNEGTTYKTQAVQMKFATK